MWAQDGALLLKVRDDRTLSMEALGKAGDEAANRFLCDALRKQRPDDGLLSEEEKDEAERLSKSRVWIIDPVDGTREYGEGRTDWAVHVALAVDGVPMVGAVALPGVGLLYEAINRSRLPAPRKSFEWSSAARDPPPRQSPLPKRWMLN